MEKLWDELGELEASLERLKAEGEKLNELHKRWERGRLESYAEFEAMIEKYAKLIRAHSKLELEARSRRAEIVCMKARGGKVTAV